MSEQLSGPDARHIAEREALSAQAQERTRRGENENGKPWYTYRRDMREYFTAKGGEWPADLMHKVEKLIAAAKKSGKKTKCADIAGEASGTAMGFDNSVTYSLTSDPERKETNVRAVEGSVFVSSHNARFLEELDATEGDLLFVMMNMVGGGALGGGDTLLLSSNPEHAEYLLETIEELVMDVYARLAPGGYLAVDVLDLVGTRNAKPFLEWLKKREIPFSKSGSEARIVITKAIPGRAEKRG